VRHGYLITLTRLYIALNDECLRVTQDRTSTDSYIGTVAMNQLTVRCVAMITATIGRMPGVLLFLVASISRHCFSVAYNFNFISTSLTTRLNVRDPSRPQGLRKRETVHLVH